MINIVVIILLPVVAFGGMFLYFKWLQKKGFSQKAEFEQQYGDDLLMISGCGLVNPSSRIPGILVRLPDRLVYKSLSARGKPTGEIMVQDVDTTLWQPAMTIPNRKIRRYRNAQVLGLNLTDGKSYLFIVAPQLLVEWEKHLTDLPGFEPLIDNGAETEPPVTEENTQKEQS